MEKSPSILIVDDDPAMRQGLQELLAPEGYDLACAGDGAEAVQKATQLVPDLVLLDVMLPQQDGFEVCRQLRADPHLASVPVIMVTTLADRDSRLQGFEAGADDFVSKPIDEIELLARVRTTTRLNRYRRLLLEQARRREIEEALRERTYDLGRRVQELGCLYAISSLIERRDMPWEKVLREVVYLIPPAWRHQEVACARVVLEGREFATENFQETAWKQTAGVVVEDESVGVVEVCYLEQRPESDKGPFSKEERRLIDAIADLLGGGVERVRAEAIRARAEEVLQQRNRELAALNRAGHAISSSLGVDQVLAALLEEVRGVMGVTATSVWLVDPQAGELVCRQATGPHGDLVRGWRLAPGEGIAGWTARSGESQVVANIRADEHYFAGVDRQTGLELRAMLSTPLWARQRVIGVLQVVDAEAGRFDETDLRLLEPLAASAAAAIENARLYEALQRELDERRRTEE